MTIHSLNKDNVSVKIEKAIYNFFEQQGESNNPVVLINEALRSFINNLPSKYHPAYGYNADKERDQLIAGALKNYKEGDSSFYDAAYKYFDKYIRLGLEPFIKKVNISKELNFIVDKLSKDLEKECVNNLSQLREIFESMEKEGLL